MPTSFRDVQVRETHPQSQMSTGTKQQGVTDNSFCSSQTIALLMRLSLDASGHSAVGL